MMDFTHSKHNAKMLIERFLETGEQPDFIEFLCFRNCYVEASFCGYSIDYVLRSFCVYAGISKKQTITVRESQIRTETFVKVEHCYCPCKGEDLIKQAKRNNIGFELKQGKIKLCKVDTIEDQNIITDEMSSNMDLELVAV